MSAAKALEGTLRSVFTPESFGLDVLTHEALTREVRAGTSIVVAGTAGSGKTSLLELLLEPISRDVLGLEGEDFSSADVPRRIRRVSRQGLLGLEGPLLVGEVRNPSAWDACRQARAVGRQVFTSIHAPDANHFLLRARNLSWDLGATLADPVFDLVVTVARHLRRVDVARLSEEGTTAYHPGELVLSSDLDDPHHVEAALALAPGWSGTYAELLAVAKDL
jgi:hypothetical protein